MDKYTFCLKIFTDFENYICDDYLVDLQDLICESIRGQDYIEETICEAVHESKTLVLKNKYDRIIIFNVKPYYIFEIYGITKEQNNGK